MSIKINGTDVVDNNRKGIFQSANVGTFANPARPVSAATGDLIWSTTDNQLQVWNGSAWVAAVGAGQAITASGGSTFTPGNGFKLHIFTSPGTFTLSSPSAQVEYAIVAGGGGGGGTVFIPLPSPLGGPSIAPGGAGGGGGVLVSSATFSSGSYTVTVGAGGAGGTGNTGGNNSAVSGSQGNPSSISGPSGTFTATGGGAGAGFRQYPSGSPNIYMGFPGGSGGGTAGFTGSGPVGTFAGASGTPGQGFPAGGGTYGNPFPHPGISPAPGGGGGADQPGGPPSGGAPYFGRGFGLDWGIPGSYGTDSQPLTNIYSPSMLSSNSPARGLGRYFGGGGGGGVLGPYPSLLGPPGVIPGGGGTPTTNAIANSGGGAGGPSVSTPTEPGRSGGSGIVIIRYRTIQ